jgi:hypothetical protein
MGWGALVSGLLYHPSRSAACTIRRSVYSTTENVFSPPQLPSLKPLRKPRFCTRLRRRRAFRRDAARAVSAFAPAAPPRAAAFLHAPPRFSPRRRRGPPRRRRGPPALFAATPPRAVSAFSPQRRRGPPALFAATPPRAVSAFSPQRRRGPSALFAATPPRAVSALWEP